VELKHAHVQDFQSIKDIDIELGSFTVLVGPSNSGKSAFLRGLKACVRNSFVPSNVRQGSSKSIIGLEFSDSSDVVIERGKSLSTYKLGSGADVFTKSARGVPDDVAKVLRFPLVGGVDATFAFQFDKPFLLSESGSTAGQVLGSLTNVSLLHAAVREANRRRQEASGVLKVRQSDVIRLSAQVDKYRDLPSQKKTLDAAKKALLDAQATSAELNALKSAVSLCEATDESLQSLQAVQPPDASEALTAALATSERLRRLTDLTCQMEESEGILRRQLKLSQQYEAQLSQAKEDYDQRLRDIGTCPTCGQAIHD
jgi:DNA repair ATPase RecN